MVIDTSAIIAILRAEPEAPRLAARIERAVARRISAASYVEIGAVMDGSHDPIVSRRMDELLDAIGAIVEPVSVEQAKVARSAYRDFGRGSGHAASLNYGDCFSYALAKVLNEPLLFKGDDFSKTDVQVADSSGSLNLPVTDTHEA